MYATFINTFGKSNMKLSQLNQVTASEQGFEFEYISSSSTEPTGVFLTVLGDQSTVVENWRNARNNQLKAKVALMQKQGKKDSFISAEEETNNGIESAAIRIIGWRGIEDDKGDYPFNLENAKFLMRHNEELLLQVLEQSRNIANFTQSKLKA